MKNSNGQIDDFQTFILPMVRHDGRKYFETVKKIFACKDASEELKNHVMSVAEKLAEDSNILSYHQDKLKGFVENRSLIMSVVNKVRTENMKFSSYENLVSDYVRKSCGGEYKSEFFPAPSRN